MPHSLTERIAAIKQALATKRVPETRPPSTPFVINPATRDAVKAQLFNLPHLQHYEIDTDNPLPEDPVALQRNNSVARLSKNDEWASEIGDGKYSRRINNSHKLFEKIVKKKMSEVTPGGVWPFPPVIIKRTVNSYDLEDGHHRIETARRLGLRVIPATLEDQKAFGHTKPVNTFVEVGADGIHKVVTPNNTKLPSINIVVPDTERPATQLSRNSDDPHATVFISPSIRENSTAALPNHPRMQALRQLLTKMGHSHEVGEGVWSDGREEVAVAKVPGHMARQVAAKLGKLFDQKAVLTFTPGAGTDQLHTVKGVKEDELVKRGIEHKTMLPGGKALIVDTDGSQATKLAGLPFDSVTGRAEFLGADNRAAARSEYDKVLGQ